MFKSYLMIQWIWNLIFIRYHRVTWWAYFYPPELLEDPKSPPETFFMNPPSWCLEQVAVTDGLVTYGIWRRHNDGHSWNTRMDHNFIRYSRTAGICCPTSSPRFSDMIGGSTELEFPSLIEFFNYSQNFPTAATFHLQTFQLLVLSNCPLK